MFNYRQKYGTDEVDAPQNVVMLSQTSLRAEKCSSSKPRHFLFSLSEINNMFKDVGESGLDLRCLELN